MSEGLSVCPVCGGRLIDKQVETLVRGGDHAALLKVSAQVCTQCGERLYDMDTLQQIDTIRDKLERQDIGDFKPVGQTFEVV